MPDFQRERLLIIGPRYANERFLAQGIGFRRDQLEMIDLFSYSSHVRQADMHKLPYGDEAFSAVVCGWVFAYSDDPSTAASEVTRVLKPGGVLVFGMETLRAEADRLKGAEDVAAAFASLEVRDNLVMVLCKPSFAC
jgi:SAM-dependent methyltransferase